jgi:L-asparagine transporter-like permease
MWLFPAGSYFTLVAILAILGAMAVTESLRIQLYCSLVVLALALVAFFVLRRKTPAAASG